MTAEDLLHPDSFVTLDDLRSRMLRQGSGDDAQLAQAANVATAIMELRTRRALRQRIWAAAVTKSCGHTADNESLTGTGFTGLLVGLDALGTNLRFGTRITEVTSDTAVKVYPGAKTTGTVNVIFGRGAYRSRHVGGQNVLLPERPVKSVSKINVVNADGTTTAVDLTNAVLDGEAGILLLTRDGIATDAPIDIEFTAGYERPSNLLIGHPEYFDLEALTFRLVEVLFGDYQHLMGRTVEVNLGQHAVRFMSLKFPPDIEDTLKEYARESL